MCVCVCACVCACVSVCVFLCVHVRMLVHVCEYQHYHVPFCACVRVYMVGVSVCLRVYVFKCIFHHTCELKYDTMYAER